MGCDASNTEKITKEIKDFKSEVVKMRESAERLEEAITKSSKEVVKKIGAQNAELNALIKSKQTPQPAQKGQLQEDSAGKPAMQTPGSDAALLKAITLSQKQMAKKTAVKGKSKKPEEVVEESSFVSEAVSSPSE